MIQFDKYFSNGLKPPTRIVKTSHIFHQCVLFFPPVSWHLAFDVVFFFSLMILGDDSAIRSDEQYESCVCPHGQKVQPPGARFDNGAFGKAEILGWI